MGFLKTELESDRNNLLWKIHKCSLHHSPIDALRRCVLPPAVSFLKVSTIPVKIDTKE